MSTDKLQHKSPLNSPMRYCLVLVVILALVVKEACHTECVHVTSKLCWVQVAMNAESNKTKDIFRELLVPAIFVIYFRKIFNRCFCDIFDVGYC